MPTSTRFAVATHVLAALALNGGRPVTSETIARSAGTNAAFIRRLMQALAEAGLTTARLGQGGGAVLARAPEAITLLDVWRAVEEEALIPMHRSEPDPTCIVGRNIVSVLGPAAARAEAALARELSETTLADVAAAIRASGAPTSV